MESDIVCEGYLTKAPPLDQPRSVSYFIVYPFISIINYVFLTTIRLSNLATSSCARALSLNPKGR